MQYQSALLQVGSVPLLLDWVECAYCIVDFFFAVRHRDEVFFPLAYSLRGHQKQAHCETVPHEAMALASSIVVLGIASSALVSFPASIFFQVFWLYLDHGQILAILFGTCSVFVTLQIYAFFLLTVK